MSIGEEDGGPAVVVNVWDRISVERWIFSAAHELGHLMMHLDAYSAEIVEEDKQQEFEADLFASHLLMPSMGFAREWGETRGLPFWNRILKIKRIFHVSDKTVLHRLLDLGIVDRQIWRKRNAFLKANFAVRHPNKFEPVRLKDYDFVPDWLDLLVRQAVENENISVGRAGEILGLSLEDMRGRVNTWVEDFGAAHT
jgi:Zn-dependent peptidase ImmA (M78 family)